MSDAMLRKRSRPSAHELSKGHHHTHPDFDSEFSFSPDVSALRDKNGSIFSVPGPLVAFSSKVLSDSDSVRSPTSPLDWKGFSSPINPQGWSPKRGSSGLQRSWNCDRVGLGLVDSLKDETVSSRKFLGFSKNCSIISGPEKVTGLSQGSNPSDLLNPASKISKPLPETSAESLRPEAVPPIFDFKSLDKPYESSDIQLKLNGNAFDLLNPASEIPKLLPVTSAESLDSEATPPVFDLKAIDMPSESIDIQLKLNMLSKIPNCSSDYVQSSLPLSRLFCCNPKPNSDRFSSLDVEDTAKLGNFSGKPSSLPISVISSHGFLGSFVSREIELSEDYTRITSHGPNPKTTHIFGDCILESHTIELSDLTADDGVFGPLSPNLEYQSHDFLSFCFSCKKKLEEGNDIYIYRGEKAFCSSDCRAQAILVEEEMEELDSNAPRSPKLTSSEEIITTAMATTA